MDDAGQPSFLTEEEILRYRGLTTLLALTNHVSTRKPLSIRTGEQFSRLDEKRFYMASLLMPLFVRGEEAVAAAVIFDRSHLVIHFAHAPNESSSSDAEPSSEKECKLDQSVSEHYRQVPNLSIAQHIHNVFQLLRDYHNAHPDEKASRAAKFRMYMYCRCAERLSRRFDSDAPEIKMIQNMMANGPDYFCRNLVPTKKRLSTHQHSVLRKNANIMAYKNLISPDQATNAIIHFLKEEWYDEYGRREFHRALADITTEAAYFTNHVKRAPSEEAAVRSCMLAMDRLEEFVMAFGKEWIAIHFNTFRVPTVVEDPKNLPDDVEIRNIIFEYHCVPEKGVARYLDTLVRLSEAMTVATRKKLDGYPAKDLFNALEFSVLRVDRPSDRMQPLPSILSTFHSAADAQKIKAWIEKENQCSIEAAMPFRGHQHGEATLVTLQRLAGYHRVSAAANVLPVVQHPMMEKAILVSSQTLCPSCCALYGRRTMHYPSRHVHHWAPVTLPPWTLRPVGQTLLLDARFQLQSRLNVILKLVAAEEKKAMSGPKKRRFPWDRSCFI